MENGNKTILIVDDNRDNVELLEDYLSNTLGFSTVAAFSGEEALEKVNEKPPELILLDVMMPKISGFEVCEILKNNETTQHIPIIMVTAKSMLFDKITGFKKGVDDYITKPFNLEELGARVKTQLRIRELQKKYYQTKIESEVDKLKLNFLSIITHELRTPLNAIIGFSELLMTSEILNEDAASYVGEIHSSGNKLLQMIDNMLFFMRIQARDIDFKMDTFTFNEVFKESLQHYKDFIKSKELTIEANFDPKLSLQGDFEIILRITNLILENAIKFSPEKGKIEIALQEKDSKVELSIMDNGNGVNEEDLNRLFKLFEQGDSSHTRKYGGTGIGLAIAHKLISIIKGKISISNRKEGGTICQIQFPRSFQLENIQIT